MYFTTALYGWEHGLMSLPRMVVGNFVNCMAVARAWKHVPGLPVQGQPAGLGQDRARVPRAARSSRAAASAWASCCSRGTRWSRARWQRALEKQAGADVPLGRVLVSNGWLDEETLAEAIAYQADLPRAHLSAELVRKHAGDLPLDLAIRHRAVHMGLNKHNRPILAVTSPLSEQALAEITQRIGQEPVQRIAREGELAVALRLLRDATPTARPPRCPPGRCWATC